MIAHRIKRTSAKDSYTKLGCYILDVKTPADPALFERLANYIIDRDGGGERVVGARVTNCGSVELADAMKEIAATQALNRRSKTDKSYHLVISFPEGERPTLDQLRDIEDTLVAAIGYADHQRISAVHDDTDNLHIHVAISKVHPENYRAIEPHYDKRKLMEACIELEKKHGLIRTNHGLVAEKAADRDKNQPRDGAEKMEAHAGRESLTSWISANAKADLVKAGAEAPTWAALHEAFAKHGLELRQKGAGLVAGVPGTSAWVKASSIDRSLSVAALTARLGAYQPPVREARRPSAEKSYTGAPRHSQPMSKPLYARFEKVRAAGEAARSAALAGVEQAHGDYAVQLRAHYRQARLDLRKRPNFKGEPKRKALLQLEKDRVTAMAERRVLASTARAQARAAYPLPTWQKFLEAEAARGDEAALSVLRSRMVAKGGLGADILTAADLSAARSVVYQQLAPTAHKNGDMVYQVADGGRVTDRAGEVRADTMSAGAAFLALSLASDRFGGQPLIIDGSDAFKAAVIEVAAIRGFDVRFSDPEMERARQVAVAQVATAQERDRVPEAGAATGLVNARNAMRATVADVPLHRLWTPADAGPMEYAGRRRLADGSEAVLLRDEAGIAVMPVTWRQAAKASRWTPGALVVTDERGRFTDPARGAAKGPQGRG